MTLTELQTLTDPALDELAAGCMGLMGRQLDASPKVFCGNIFKLFTKALKGLQQKED